MPIADPDVLTTRPCLHAYYPRILLMLDQGGLYGQTGCVRYVYIAFASDQGCEYVNQFYVSFGLADRYLILMGTKCYRDI